MSCNSKEKYGKIQQSAKESIKYGQKFTIHYPGWISKLLEGRKTFAKMESTGSMRTDNSILPRIAGSSESTIGSEFEFKLVKCPGNNSGVVNSGVVKYGDKVKIKADNAPLYVQCGASVGQSTCSGVSSPGDCGAGEWQTFKIRNNIGKSGPVCWGDDLYLIQLFGNGDAITAAGDGATWGQKPSISKNSIINLMPVNGSIYKDPTKETEAYKLIQKSELCKATPWDPGCITNQIALMFSKFKGIMITVGLVIIALIIFKVVYKVAIKR